MITIKEGFWYSKNEPNLPMPLHSDKEWEGKKKFLNKLKLVQERIRQQFYKGSSVCRICNERNGFGEYRFKDRYFDVVWPEGFIHYIEKHNISPSHNFAVFIANFPVDQKETTLLNRE
jgi:hypothetical protein